MVDREKGRKKKNTQKSQKKITKHGNRKSKKIESLDPRRTKRNRERERERDRITDRDEEDDTQRFYHNDNDFAVSSRGGTLMMRRSERTRTRKHRQNSRDVSRDCRNIWRKWIVGNCVRI